MTRVEIYNKMKELGIKHYINSASVLNPDSARFTWTIWEGFHKCHNTDESFDKEIELLERRGYNFFDVIHLHE